LLLQNIPLNISQSAARFCSQFMSGYRLNLSGPLLDYTVKKYKGHRQIPNNVIEKVRLYFEKKKAPLNIKIAINHLLLLILL
jgi:hypothetical protein